MPPRKQQEVVVAISDDENDDALTRKTKRDRGKATQQPDDGIEYIPNEEEIHEADKASHIPLLKQEIQAIKKKARNNNSSRTIRQRSAMPPSQQQSTAGPSSQRNRLDSLTNLTDKMIDDAEGVLIRYKNEEVAADMTTTRTRPSSQGMDALTRLVIRHVLFSCTEKPGMPLSRAELAKVVTESNARASGLVKYIIAMAQRRLVEDFGLEMAELTRKTRRGSSSDGSKYYVVRSIVPWPLYDALVATNTASNKIASAKQGLLGVILGVIHLAGGTLSERDLWNYLSNTGVTKEAANHPAFDCAPAAVIEEFVKKRLLFAEKENGPEGPEMVYSGGEVADWEVGEGKVKQFCKEELAEEVGGGDE